MPKYSVVIPIYNVENYLQACIDSVLAQSVPEDYEIVLIDDGSPDGSGVICDRYAREHTNIRVFHDTNHGVSHARNVGMELAKGEYILFLDADDLLESNLFEVLQPLAATGMDVIRYGHHRLYEDGTKERCFQKILPMGEPGKTYLARLFQKDLVPTFYPWCYLYRREFLKNSEIRFREDLKVSEDFEFNMRVLASAQHICGTDQPLYQYRIRAGSVTATVSQKKLMDNLMTKAAYFRKYPVSAMANLYAENAILVAKLPKEETKTAEDFLKENRDIWNHVSEAPYKLGRIFVNILGDRNGARAYFAVRAMVRKLQGRS